MEITLKKPKNIKTKNIIITIVYYFFLSVGALAMLLPFFLDAVD